MNHFYVACDIGRDVGRVMLGSLQQEQLTVSEVRRFENVPKEDKGEREWNVPELYQEILEGLRTAGSYDESIDSLSCTSWGGDYLLFQADGTLITPAYHPKRKRVEDGIKAVLAKVSWEKIYEETGARKRPENTLFQLGAESGKRLKHASHLLPIADGFNYLLTGVPRVEVSSAGQTQLFNPATHAWSEQLLGALRLPSHFLPPLVQAGTLVGPLRHELAEQMKLHDAQVIASCSHEIAAALAGLPVANGESWAFLREGTFALAGAQIPRPIINEVSRELGFTNEIGYGGSVAFYKATAGSFILEECHRFWEGENRQLDTDLLGHLAGSATPFESLIDPLDARFSTPGDMPLKIQAFCRETKQPIPRKPGPVFRCILESLALHYRRILREIAYLTGSEISKLYLLGGKRHNLLNHFTANALQIPVVVVPPEITALGNVVVQALALGHIGSIEQARAALRGSLKTELITPHANAWNAAYDRFVGLTPSAP